MYCGLTHSASAVKVPGTQKFKYSYVDGQGTKYRDAKSIQNNAQGAAAYFDLTWIASNGSPLDQQGYLSFEVQKGNSQDIRANAYGHYDHLTIALSISPGIGIKTGSISVGGVTTTTKATSPMILFDY